MIRIIVSNFGLRDEHWLINPKDIAAVRIVEGGNQVVVSGKNITLPFRLYVFLHGTPTNHSGLEVRDPPSIDRILDLEGGT